MKEGLSTPERVEFLFGQIKNKAVAEDAYAALERFESHMKGKKEAERGAETELFVMGVLLQLPYVDRVVRSVSNGPDDKMGIDLRVGLLIEAIHEVGVQVKSNDTAVGWAMNKLGYIGEQNQYEPIIVLNGRTSPGVIRESFGSQLRIIERNVPLPQAG